MAPVPEKMVKSPAERRVALVIGNGNYINAVGLRNPANDAQAVAAKLREMDFDEVIEGIDLGVLDMDRKISDFAEKILGVEAALFYFAGHGLQVNGENYLVPTDAILANEGQLRQTIKLQDQLNMMGGRALVSIVILDCCRDNPFARSLASRRPPGPTRSLIASGLTKVDVRSVQGALVAFATEPGSVANDGDGLHSPYTGALLEHMARAGQSLADMLTRVAKSVAGTTDRNQIPWYNSSLQDVFYLRRGSVEGVPVPPDTVNLEKADESKDDGDKTRRKAIVLPLVPIPSPDTRSDSTLVQDTRSTSGENAAGVETRVGRGRPLIWSILGVAIVVMLSFSAFFGLPKVLCACGINWKNGPTAKELVQQLSTPDRVLADRVAAFSAGTAKDIDKQFLLSAIILRLQSQLIYVDPDAAIPSHCRAPTPKGPSSTPQLPLLCAGLDAKTQVQMVAILAAVPKAIWQDPAFKAQRDLALVALADIDAQRRFQTEQFLPESTSDLVSLKMTLGVGERPKNLVTLQFNGTFPRGNAQAIMDRLVSLGWNVQGVERSPNRSNEIRYGSNPAQPPIAEQLSQDLSIQRLTVAANFNPSLANSQQLDIYLTNPLPAWGSSMPSSGWCYQEYDPAKADAGRYLVACHATQPACLTVRGNAPQKKQSDCILVDAVDKARLNFAGGGYANSWFVYSSQKVGSPFPAVPL